MVRRGWVVHGQDGQAVVRQAGFVESRCGYPWYGQAG